MKSNETIPKELSSRQLQALPYILSCPTYEEAARKAKISPKQLYQWLKDPIFKEELKQQRNVMFCDSLAFLKAATQKATETLIGLLDNKDPRIKLQASEKVLTLSYKAAELYEIEERLTAIEALHNKKAPRK